MTVVKGGGGVKKGEGGNEGGGEGNICDQVCRNVQQGLVLIISNIFLLSIA